ncbi:DNA-binding protein (plasmid) [Pseudomonas fluorescens A506]|nr:DNA-binding protein [Pseudomonas fluorescens A506]
MTSPTRKFIGGRIRSLRKAKGITQAVLAEALECEIATISRYERGDNPPDSEQLLKLAKLLGVSPMDILPSESDIAREQVIELRATLLELIYKIESPLLLEKLIKTIHLIEKN